MGKEITSLTEALLVLKRAKELNSHVAIVVCLADKISTLALDGAIAFASSTRLQIEGKSGQFAIALDGARIGYTGESWLALEETRAGLRRAPLFAEIGL